MKRLLFWTLTGLLAAGCNHQDGGPKNGTKPPPRTPKTFDSDESEIVATREARKSFIPKARTLVAWPRARFPYIKPKSEAPVLEVAFLDADGRVADVKHFDPGREAGVMPEVEARYAYFFPQRTDVAKGDSVVLSEAARKTVAEELVTIKVGDAVVYVEISATYDERQYGLMHRPRMSKEDGMLFVYPNASKHSFWMKNTLMPLDIAHFGADGLLLNVCEMDMYPDPAHPGENYKSAPSDGDAQYVLELNRSWFRSRGLIDGAGRPVKPVRLVVPDFVKADE